MGPKKLQYGLLNIVTHPHTYENYLALFREAARKRISVKVAGNDRAVLDEPFSGEVQGMQYIYGNLHRYSAIDEKGKWVNLETLDDPDDEDMSKVKDLKNLGPNHKMFPYFFFPKNHTMLVILKYHNRTISIHTFRMVIEELFKSPELTEFGPAYVNIIQDKAVLTDIKNLSRIKSVKLKVSLPNSDGAFDSYSSIIQTMDSYNAKKATVEYRAKKNQSLNFNESLKKNIEDTLMHGGTVVEGVSDEGNDVTINTLENPRRIYVNSFEEMENLREVVPTHAIDRNKDIFRPSIE